MAIVTEIPKENIRNLESFEADGDLSALKNCLVVPSAQASGKMQVKAPTGQGVLAVGVLKNAPTDTLLAEVVTDGTFAVKAGGALNAGIELTIKDTGGTVMAAAADDYVIGISLEAAAEANQLIAVKVFSPYQKN